MLPPDLSRLESLNLGGNQLTSLTLPCGPDQFDRAFLRRQSTDQPHVASGHDPVDRAWLPRQSAYHLRFVRTLGRHESGRRRRHRCGIKASPCSLILWRPVGPAATADWSISVWNHRAAGSLHRPCSTNLTAWSALGVATNPLGSVIFTDVTAHLSPQKFYRALLQSPPANMVFIPPNTFTMGSPTNELDRSSSKARKPR